MYIRPTNRGPYFCKPVVKRVFPLLGDMPNVSLVLVSLNRCECLVTGVMNAYLQGLIAT